MANLVDFVRNAHFGTLHRTHGAFEVGFVYVEKLVNWIRVQQHRPYKERIQEEVELLYSLLDYLGTHRPELLDWQARHDDPRELLAELLPEHFEVLETAVDVDVLVSVPADEVVLDVKSHLPVASDLKVVFQVGYLLFESQILCIPLFFVEDKVSHAL